MSQIRSDILYTRKIKEARNCEQEILRLHIATPICPDNEIDETEKYDSDNEEIYIQVSDDDIISDKEIDSEIEINNDNEDETIRNNEQKWNQIIEEWIELGNHENQFENHDDEIFLSEEWNSDFNLEGREVHPVDDETAKW